MEATSICPETSTASFRASAVPIILLREYMRIYVASSDNRNCTRGFSTAFCTVFSPPRLLAATLLSRNSLDRYLHYSVSASTTSNTPNIALLGGQPSLHVSNVVSFQFPTLESHDMSALLCLDYAVPFDWALSRQDYAFANSG